MSTSRSKTLRDVTSRSQRARLLERLQAGPIDTFTAMADLNICRPGARISELRAAGYPIQTHRRTIEDAQGFEHPAVAVYYLSA